MTSSSIPTAERQAAHPRLALTALGVQVLALATFAGHALSRAHAEHAAALAPTDDDPETHAFVEFGYQLVAFAAGVAGLVLLVALVAALRARNPWSPLRAVVVLDVPLGLLALVAGLAALLQVVAGRPAWWTLTTAVTVVVAIALLVRGMFGRAGGGGPGSTSADQ